MTPAQLLALSEERLVKLQLHLKDASDDRPLIQLGVVAEFLLAAPDAYRSSGSATLTRPRAILADAALRCLRGGLLERALKGRVEHLYVVSMLLRLATEASDYWVQDLVPVAELLAEGGIPAGEQPSLTLVLVRAHLRCAGLVVEERAAAAGLGRSLDKRALRCRTDEHDVAAVLKFAQLHVMGRVIGALPRVLPQLLLAHSILKQDMNWLAPLAWVGMRVFPRSPASAALLAQAQVLLAVDLQARDDLLPLPQAPPDSELHTEYAQLAAEGLRLRSSLACCALLMNGDAHG